MQLLVLILNKTESLRGILSGFLKNGIKDATIYDSMGMVQYIGHDSIDAPPIFGSLRQYFNPDRENNKTVVSLLSDEQVKVAINVINEETGGLSKPNVGIVFTVPVSGTEGIEKTK